MFKITGKYNQAIIYTDNLDEDTISQVIDLCNEEWVEGTKIAMMPDVHFGMGSTIGTTIQLNGKVRPNIVGDDIGCGMLTVELPFENIEDKLSEIDNYIKNNIYSGNEIYDTPIFNLSNSKGNIEQLYCYKEMAKKDIQFKSIGSLGGGNHFIEINKSENDGKYYLVIHTGSRNLGKQINKYYNLLSFKELQKKLVNDYINELKRNGYQNEIQKMKNNFVKNLSNNINKKNSYLFGEGYQKYLHDMNIGVEFSKINREQIANMIISNLYNLYFKEDIKGTFNEKSHNYLIGNIKTNYYHTIHNYIDVKNNILRKGSISCQKGEKVLIPINMQFGSLVCIGKGNPNYNYSGPHGAGRIYSRKQAKENISLEEFQESMKYIFTSCVCESTIDESPMAYKDVNVILDNIRDTAELIDILKPIYNFKAH